MNIEPKVGKSYVIISYDDERVNEIIKRFGTKFPGTILVDADTESIYEAKMAENGEVVLNSVQTQVKVGETVHLARVRSSEFFAALSHIYRRYLVIVRIRERPLRYFVPLPECATVWVINSPYIVPDALLATASLVTEAYVATDDEIALELKREGLPAAPEIVANLRGLTLGEIREVLLETRGATNREKMVRDQAQMRKVARLRSFKADLETRSVTLDSAFIDSFYRDALRQYTDRGSIVLVGYPGSGKSYLARALAFTNYSEVISLSAGRVLEIGKQEDFMNIMMTVKAMGRIAMIIDDYHHVITDRRIYADMLRFLEQLRSSLIVMTMPDPTTSMISVASQRVNEALRPGRVDEIIPVVPPLDEEVRLGVVLNIYYSLLKSALVREVLTFDDLEMISNAAPLLYPAEYMSLISRVVASKNDHKPDAAAAVVAEFRSSYSARERLKSVMELLNICRRLGNTSIWLLREIEQAVREEYENRVLHS